jgi:hypothetical protein
MACQRKLAKACVPAALLPIIGRGSWRKSMKQRAWILLGIAACLLAGCGNAPNKAGGNAANARAGIGDTNPTKFWQEITESSCRSGNRQECADDASLYASAISTGSGAHFGERRQPSKAETALSLGFFLQACDLGDANSCFLAGKTYEKQGRMELARQSIQKAMPMLASACDEDHNGVACSNLGGIYRIGKYVPRDTKKMFAWYQKADQILAAWNESHKERLKNAQAFCNKHPSMDCKRTVARLKFDVANDKHSQFLGPHWKAMKYDAETMPASIAPGIITGQWAMVPPLDISHPGSSMANVVDLKADGTVDLHKFDCDWFNRAVNPGTIEKSTWHISGNHILVFNHGKQTAAFAVKFAGSNEMSVFKENQGNPQEGVAIDYQRTKDFHPLCDEYFDARSLDKWWDAKGKAMKP